MRMILVCLIVIAASMAAGCIMSQRPSAKISEVMLAPGEALQLAEPARLLVVNIDAKTGSRTVGYVLADTSYLIGRSPSEPSDTKEIRSEPPRMLARW